MDQDFTQPDELSARREAMRERLRLKADRVLEVVEELADPKSFLEVERAARAIMATDKMIIQLFSAPKAVRFDMRFGGADYGDARERGPSNRLPDERTETSENSIENAPIVSFAATSPVSQGKMKADTATSFAVAGEDDRVDAPSVEKSIENSIKVPVSGRLTKRQKRRQRAFGNNASTAGQVCGLSP